MLNPIPSSSTSRSCQTQVNEAPACTPRPTLWGFSSMPSQISAEGHESSFTSFCGSISGFFISVYQWICNFCGCVTTPDPNVDPNVDPNRGCVPPPPEPGPTPPPQPPRVDLFRNRQRQRNDIPAPHVPANLSANQELVLSKENAIRCDRLTPHHQQRAKEIAILRDLIPDDFIAVIASEDDETLKTIYSCPVTCDVISKPVFHIDPLVLPAGYSADDGVKHPFEFEALQQWLAEGNTRCPHCNAPIDQSMLRFDPVKQEKIAAEMAKAVATLTNTVLIERLKKVFTDTMGARDDDTGRLSLEETQMRVANRLLHLPNNVIFESGNAEDIFTRVKNLFEEHVAFNTDFTRTI